jgi:hypothetical protein
MCYDKALVDMDELRRLLELNRYPIAEIEKIMELVGDATIED